MIFLWCFFITYDLTFYNTYGYTDLNQYIVIIINFFISYITYRKELKMGWSPY